MMGTGSRQLFTYLFALFLFTGCASDYAYQEQREIDGPAWTYADSLAYQFRIDDTLTVYNLHLIVDHLPEFPFENLYVRLHTVFPDGERLSEVVSLQLSDDLNRWLGDSRGDGYRLDIPIQEGAYFNQPGPYQLIIEQYTRRDSLRGVQAVAFGLEEVSKR